MIAQKMGAEYFQVIPTGLSATGWWTVMGTTSGDWVITNHQGRRVSPDGVLGKKILRAVETA
jgi:hypothetical protein